MRDSVREFLAAECPTSLVRQAEDSGTGHVPALWQKMTDLGWLGICLPEQYGGSGQSLIDQAVLFEEFGRALVPGPLLTSSVLAAQIVLHGGNDRQKQDLLPGMVKGEIILTLARGERLETSSQSGGVVLMRRGGACPPPRPAHPRP
ncbi:MAG: acyl-CoA dehydrogenase family protein, partial [Chloroflexi bacterium]|nr:acyl-CoA dehydrogenase family protein [Chloroflexota bacterium]